MSSKNCKDNRSVVDNMTYGRRDDLLKDFPYSLQYGKNSCLLVVGAISVLEITKVSLLLDTE